MLVLNGTGQPKAAPYLGCMFRAVEDVSQLAQHILQCRACLVLRVKDRSSGLEEQGGWAHI